MTLPLKMERMGFTLRVFNLFKVHTKKEAYFYKVGSHLKETEPAGAELVLALAVLQREELYQLGDEHRV